MRNERNDKAEKPQAQQPPLFLDMGQGSREQAFRLQKPQLTLVHSR